MSVPIFILVRRIVSYVFSAQYVVEVDGNVAVAVGTDVFVKKADCVTHFVGQRPFPPYAGEGDVCLVEVGVSEQVGMVA